VNVVAHRRGLIARHIPPHCHFAVAGHNLLNTCPGGGGISGYADKGSFGAVPDRSRYISIRSVPLLRSQIQRRVQRRVGLIEWPSLQALRFVQLALANRKRKTRRFVVAESDD